MSDLLEAIKVKQARLAELRKEAAGLEAELRNAGAILSGRGAPALGNGSKPRSRHGFTNGVRKRPIQEGSSVDWAFRVLREAGRPLPVEDIISAIQVAGGPVVAKPTLVSNLSRYVMHSDTFTRPARNTYGLVAWNRRQDVTDYAGT